MKRTTRHGRQAGASLLIALIMLIVVMLLGVAAARMSLMNEKSSRNDRDRQIAFEAAESALHDAEMDLAGPRGQIDTFPELAGRCHESGAFYGLCRAGSTPLWPVFSMSAATPWVDYGRFTGRRFPYGAASLAARPPRYLVELISLGKAGSTLQRYRVTAVGFGAGDNTQVVLQSIHAIPASDDSTNLPPARISWREIGNWQENSLSTR